MRVHNKKRYQENPELRKKARANTAKYKAAHPEHRLKSKEYAKKRRENPEYVAKQKERLKKWRAIPENKERVKRTRAKKKLLAELYDLETLILENPL